MTDAQVPRPLPPRAPRPWIVHALVDGAVAFLVMAFPALVLGTGAVIVAIGLAIGLGLGLASTTRRAEARALAAREGGPTSD